MLNYEPVPYLLGLTLKSYKNRLTAEFREHQLELGFEQFVTLHFLSSEDEDPTQQDLANHLQKDKSSILRQINTLIDREYVIRIQDRQDKRKKKLILTGKGHETLAFMRHIGKDVEEELLSGIAPESLSTFREVMKKIQANAGFDDEFCRCS